MNEDSGTLNPLPCKDCGEENGMGDLYCVRCGLPLKEAKGRMKGRLIALGVAGLLLVGAGGYFMSPLFESGAVASIDGEEVTRKEFNKRLERSRRFNESRFGKAVFEGKEGEKNLQRLRAALFEEIMTERLLLKEARDSGLMAAPEKEIEVQMETIKKMHGLSDKDLEKRTGVSLEEFKTELRKEWLISRFVEKNFMEGDKGNSEQLFQEWFSTKKQQAKVEVYGKLDLLAPAVAVCCKGGGCAGGEQERPLDSKIEKEARVKALQYYESKTSKKGATARVMNYGCHIQVDILEGGRVAVSYTYDRGEIQEI